MEIKNRKLLTGAFILGMSSAAFAIKNNEKICLDNNLACGLTITPRVIDCTSSSCEDITITNNTGRAVNFTGIVAAYPDNNTSTTNFTYFFATCNNGHISTGSSCVVTITPDMALTAGTYNYRPVFSGNFAGEKADNNLMTQLQLQVNGACSSNVNIGDLAGGGVVFETSPVCKILALPETEVIDDWGCFEQIITGAFSDTDGQANTTAIVTQCSEYSSLAARDCDNLVSNSFSDWYLPAKEELGTIYDEVTVLNNNGASLTLDGGEGNPEAGYWSSTEAGDPSSSSFSQYGAWTYDFSSDPVGDRFFEGLKFFPRRVRCIRLG